jgi:peroxiredoxin Q/BCP
MGLRDRLASLPDRVARKLGMHGELPAVGSTAPALDAPDADGRIWTLDDLRGAPAVIYFYPKDDTPGCTREACSLRDALPTLGGARVLGVSTDAAGSHRAFAQKFNLPFPLLADPSGDLVRRWGVRSAVGVARRVTFVLDAEGRISTVIDPVQVDRHVDDVKDALQRLGMR